MSCRRVVLEEGDYIDDFYDMLIFRINFLINCFISERYGDIWEIFNVDFDGEIVE
jgi:hypothetical protein